MSFKPGDRVRAKVRHDLKGTVKMIDSHGIFIVMDQPFIAINEDGEKYTHIEGYVREEHIELIEKSDWASIWDNN